MYFLRYILAKKAGLSQQKCNMALYGLPVLPIAEAFEKTVTGNPITITDALAQDALSLQVSFTPTQDGTPSIDSEPTTDPYLLKTIPRGNKEYYSLVGGTVAWNQLVRNGDFADATNWITNAYTTLAASNNVGILSFTFTNAANRIEQNINTIKDHVYFLTAGCKSTANTSIFFATDANMVLTQTSMVANINREFSVIRKSPSNGTKMRYYVDRNGVLSTNDNVELKNLQIIDLTQMFANDPAIAEYAYSLEQSEAGSGIAWLKSYGFFTKEYYPYSAGELKSVNTSGKKIVGFNQWDEQWNVSGSGIKAKNLIPVFPNTTYYFKSPCNAVYYKYDKDENVIGSAGGLTKDTTFTTSPNQYYMWFDAGSFYDGTTYKNDICINISDPQKNGTYKPYSSTTYPIQSTDLRGLFKLSSANKLYCEGDVYPPSGNAVRNFEYRAYQSGDESLADAITDGTHTVVKLATPTTESATPYTSPIDVEAGGTEEFIDSRTVPIPVGNETYYASEYEVHGKTNVSVNHSATEGDTPTEYEIEFTQQGTVYGGTVDVVSGVLTVTWGYIASYNGETLPGEWMSSKDVYSEGTTPSTGAEVAYELTTPQVYNLTPQQVTMLLGNNYLETEDGTMTITYMARNGG